MKTALALLLSALPALASEFPIADANRIADAIWLAEGGKRAATPYGVRGCKDPARARQIVLGAILTRWRAFEARVEAGIVEESFISFLGRRYCPPDAHPLNRNWVRNVEFHYAKAKNARK